MELLLKLHSWYPLLIIILVSVLLFDIISFISISTVNAFIVTSLGPVLDIGFLQINVLNVIRLSLSKSLFKIIVEAIELFIPCVYDAVLVIRLVINFHHGVVVSNVVNKFILLLDSLVYSESYLMALSYAVPVFYLFLCVDVLVVLNYDVQDLSLCKIIVGISLLFLISKSYLSFLVAEICSLNHGGICRSISLGPTEGLNTQFIVVIIIYQSVVVPIGIVVLGRIFNVIGCCLDRMVEQAVSCCYSLGFLIYKIISNGVFMQVNSSSDLLSLWFGKRYNVLYMVVNKV